MTREENTFDELVSKLDTAEERSEPEDISIETSQTETPGKKKTKWKWKYIFPQFIGISAKKLIALGVY